MKYYIDKFWCINCKKVRDRTDFRKCHFCKRYLESLIVKRAYYCASNCDNIFKLKGHDDNDSIRFCSECSEDKEVVNRFIDNEIKLKEEKKNENKKRREVKQEEFELSLKMDAEKKRLKDNINKLYDNNDELINNLRYHCEYCNSWVGYADMNYHITSNYHINFVRLNILEKICALEDLSESED